MHASKSICCFSLSFIIVNEESLNRCWIKKQFENVTLGSGKF